MAKYRNALPQLSGHPYLTDAGIETDLIFNHGIKIREFASHTLFETEQGREAIANYLKGFISLAANLGVGYILDSQTWKAHMHWADDLDATAEELRKANLEAIQFIADIRSESSSNAEPIVLNAIIGPRGDAYAPDRLHAANEAEAYHKTQLQWLAETEADMVTALTFTQSEEAIGIVRAAKNVGLPIVVSFTVETDGKLPTGETLSSAITSVDAATDNGPVYFMINCAHPDHFYSVLAPGAWASRIRGIRCNASRKSHAELDESETLDDGNPRELARQYQDICELLPSLNIFGGCCGTDLRHVREIAQAVIPTQTGGPAKYDGSVA